jgi:hypothetical protein
MKTTNTNRTIPRTRNLAGVEVPDTPAVNAAIEYARHRYEPYLFNHVMRSWLFSVKIASRTGIPYDEEVVAIAALLHDLGLTEGFPGPNRFEVEGANAARNFAREHALDAPRLQLLWDSIALHSTPSIGIHKELEVGFASAGIGLDYGGVGFGQFPAPDMDAILREFPRLDMKNQMNDCFCRLAHAKPETAYDNFLQDFAVRCVPGFRNPVNLVDMLMNAPFAE